MEQLEEMKMPMEEESRVGMDQTDKNSLHTSISGNKKQILSVDDDPAAHEDLVELYFRKMGSFPLLNRRQEVEIAKRIEMANQELIELFTESPLIMRYLMDLKAKLESGEVRAHRLITGVDEHNHLIEDEKAAFKKLLRTLKLIEKCIHPESMRIVARETCEATKTTVPGVKILKKYLIQCCFSTSQIETMCELVFRHHSAISRELSQIRDCSAALGIDTGEIDESFYTHGPKAEMAFNADGISEPSGKRKWMHSASRRYAEKIRQSQRRIRDLLNRTGMDLETFNEHVSRMKSTEKRVHRAKT